KRVFLVILFTSFSGSLVSRIPGAVQDDIISMAVILVVKRDHFPGVKDDMEVDKRFASDCLFWGLKYGGRKIIPE
ncbi:hypothetical protein QP656_24020, partial [Escherichia coli]|nr:hypothetical protein [Escherichia coli]